MLLSRRAALVAVAGGRALLLAGAPGARGSGDLKSIWLDGTGAVELGGGDGQDRVADLVGDRVLFTVRSGGTAGARIARVDGAQAVAIGGAGVEERAFAIAGDRAVFTRDTAAGTAIVSVALDGTDERTLAAAERGARPVLAGPDGRVLIETGTGGLLAVPAAGGAAIVVDPAAGRHVRGVRVAGDVAVWVADRAGVQALRAARLDGRGAYALCERPTWLPSVEAIHDGRVVFHRGLAGQPEGGAVFTVRLDGSGLQRVGSAVLGGAHAEPTDQDFEAITPGGRLILEAEFEGVFGAQLLAAGTEGLAARSLTPLGRVRYAGLIP